MSFLFLSKMQVRDRHIGTIRVEQNCACVRVRKGLMLRVCLQVSCGAPPRPTALDPPLVVHVCRE